MNTIATATKSEITAPGTKLRTGSSCHVLTRNWRAPTRMNIAADTPTDATVASGSEAIPIVYQPIRFSVRFSNANTAVMRIAGLV